MMVPTVEVLAAFRMSYRTAEREGFPRTAAQVLNYIIKLEAMREDAEGLGYWIEGFEITPILREDINV